MRCFELLSVRLRIMLTTAILAVSTTSAKAINITFNIDLPQNFPSYDPDGSGLMSIATAAAQMWEELRPGNENYSWSIHYDDFQSGNTIAVANGFDNTIRFKTQNSWFIDPTPFDNSEFGPFKRDMVESLDGTDKSNWFQGSVPDELEYGYTANPLSGGPAVGMTDMLSVMLHEMGHLTGISYNLFKPAAPIYSDFIGATGNVYVNRADESHIIPTTSLMEPTDNGGRTLPSALDVMVNANEKGNHQVHLQRVDFIDNLLIPSDHSWVMPFNWTGGDTPDSTQDAFIGQFHEVTQLGNSDVGSLTMSNHAQLDLQGHLHIVNNYDQKDKSSITVEGTGNLDVDQTLTVNSYETKFQMNGGHVSAKDISLENGASIRGHGTINFSGDLTNSGDISAQGGLLAFNTSPPAHYNLGNNNGTADVYATDGDIKFGSGYYEPMKGHMTIKEGHYIEFSGNLGDITFVPGGKLIFQNGPNSGDTAILRALFQPNSIELRGGTLEVSPIVNAKIQFATIHIVGQDVLDVGDNAVLDLSGSTDFTTGKHTGEGRVVQNGPVDIKGAVELNFDRYDLDGDAEDNYVDVHANDSLTLKVKSMDGDNSYDGTIRLQDKAKLDIEINQGFIPNWKLGGTLELQNATHVKGSFLVNRGEILVDKSDIGNIDALLQLDPGSKVTLQKNATINFTEHVEAHGGIIASETGLPVDSMAQLFSTMSVADDTTINVEYFNWDGSPNTDSSTSIAARKTLTIHAGKIGTPDGQFLLGSEGFGDTININSGTLDVVVGANNRVGPDLPSEWSLNEGGVMNLNRIDRPLPTVMGSHLNNYGTISGTGQFENVLDNFGSIIVGHENEIGYIDLNNIFHQHEKGLMSFELAGLEPLTEFDQIRAEDLVGLDGTLSVDLINGFSPTNGDVFRLINATFGGSVLGKFNDLILPGGSDHWDVIYGNDYVDLRYVAVPEASTLVLLACGSLIGGGVVVVRRRR